MLLVGIINMATALLVLILERSRMIGILKALVENNIFFQKIFLYNGTLIMSKGLLWGNIVGLGFYFSQHYTLLTFLILFATTITFLEYYYYLCNKFLS